MPVRYYANAPATTLASSATAGATTIEVASDAGFPISYPYTLILDRGTSSEEAVSVTSAAGTTLTVTRAIDGTTAFTHNVGGTVEHGITAQDIREPNTHINANSGVHGATGSVVGTTDAQTLTNKDLSSATNTFPSSLATDDELSTHADLGAHVPIGVWMPYGGDTDPDANWLIADGRALNRTTYATLFARLGTKFGSGDGSTTFNIPDLREKLPLGAGGSHTEGSTGGSFTQTLVAANIPAHVHSMAHTHSINHDHASFSSAFGGAHQHQLSRSASTGGTYNIPKGDDFTDSNVAGLALDGAHTHTVDVPAFSGSSGASSAANTGSTGSGSSFDITNPYVASNYIIRVL